MADAFDPRAAKLARYRLLTAQYARLAENIGADVSEQGRSISTTAPLAALAAEIRTLENELRTMSPFEATTLIFPQ